MKKVVNEAKPKGDARKNQPKKYEVSGHDELKTDPPLSEKDEVKQAEEKLRKGKK